MPLDPDKIKALLAKKQAGTLARASGSSGGGSGNKPRTTRTRKAAFDPNDRSYAAWFKLEHHLLDDDKEPMFCENPHCVDPRDKEHGQVVVIVHGRRICRYCFVQGWLTGNLAQLEIGSE